MQFVKRLRRMVEPNNWTGRNVVGKLHTCHMELTSELDTIRFKESLSVKLSLSEQNIYMELFIKCLKLRLNLVLNLRLDFELFHIIHPNGVLS